MIWKYLAEMCNSLSQSFALTIRVFDSGSIKFYILFLQALLSAAEPDDPQDAVVASQYKDNYEMFALTAKHWTNAYAGGRNESTLSLYLSFN